MKSVVIAGYARSPFHFAKKGALARVRPDELCAQVIAALIERTKLDPADIEDVIALMRLNYDRIAQPASV